MVLLRTESSFHCLSPMRCSRAVHMECGAWSDPSLGKICPGAYFTCWLGLSLHSPPLMGLMDLLAWGNRCSTHMEVADLVFSSCTATYKCASQCISTLFVVPTENCLPSKLA